MKVSFPMKTMLLLILALFGLVAFGWCLTPSPVLANPHTSDCASYLAGKGTPDALCMFVEDFDDTALGNGCPAAYGCSAPGNITIVSGSLDTGGGRKAEMVLGGGFWDTNFPATFSDGDVVWWESWIQFEAGLVHHLPSGGWKVFEWRTNPGPCTGDGGRWLFSLHGQDFGGTDTAWVLDWANYAQVASVCSPGTPAGETNENLAQNVGSTFFFSPPNLYHIVIELKLSTTSAGYLKAWVNDTLYWNRTGRRTVGASPFQIWRFGGAVGTPNGKRMWFDKTRWTRTNLAPGGAPAQLNAPANLLLCSGPGCAPALVVPLGALAGLLVWVRRRLKRRA
jgi:hypothetical protein